MIKLLKERIANWKQKAIKRQASLKALYKSFEELKLSRDSWKQKAKNYQIELNSLKQENIILKKNNIAQ